MKYKKTRNFSRKIENRMNQWLKDIKSKYIRKEYETKEAHMSDIFRAIRDVYYYVHKGNVSFYKADVLPLREEYHENIQRWINEYDFLFYEASYLQKMLEEQIRKNDMINQTIEKNIKLAKNYIVELEKEDRFIHNEVIFRESFETNQQNYTLSTLYAWSDYGTLTLQPIHTKSVMERGSVEILRGNGLPGNTKEVKTVDGEIQFIGKDGLHLFIEHILDGNEDTRFEYEIFFIDPETKRKINNKGIRYLEGISFVKENDEPLEMVLRISLENEQEINHLSISPYFSFNKTRYPLTIQSIRLIGEGEKRKDVLLSADEITERKIYFFEPFSCKEIEITIQQHIGYDTEIGHFFYEQSGYTDEYILDELYHPNRRVEGPLPSIQSLLLHYDATSGRVIYPKRSLSDEEIKEDELKNKLFLPSPPETEYIKVGLETIPAKRYAIGINNVGGGYTVFKKEGSYVSKKYESKQEVIGVFMESNHLVHNEKTKIEYAISIDEGKTWYNIRPVNTVSGAGKVMYLINSHTNPEARINEFGYIDVSKKVYNVMVRVDMYVEDSNMYTSITPCLYDYTLHLVVNGVETND